MYVAREGSAILRSLGGYTSLRLDCITAFRCLCGLRHARTWGRGTSSSTSMGVCPMRLIALPCVSRGQPTGRSTVCGVRNRNLHRLCMMAGTEGTPYTSTDDRRRSTEETWGRYCIVQELPQIGGVWRTI